MSEPRTVRLFDKQGTPLEAQWWPHERSILRDLAAHAKSMGGSEDSDRIGDEMVHLVKLKALCDGVIEEESPQGSLAERAADRRQQRELSNPDVATPGRVQAEPEETAAAAALNVWPRTGTQRRQVLDALGRAGERGMTDDELRSATGVRRARTRRQELEEGGWVKKSGRTREVVETGNLAIVWVLAPAAASIWRPVR